MKIIRRAELVFAHIAAWSALIVLSERTDSAVASAILTVWALCHAGRSGWVMAERPHKPTTGSAQGGE